MEETLTGAGIACIVAAIIGGGLKAFGLEIPALESFKRQSLLAVFGVALLGLALVIHLNGSHAEHPSSAQGGTGPAELPRPAPSAASQEHSAASASRSGSETQRSSERSDSSVGDGPARLSKDFPNSSDFYPNASRTLSESGSVNIRACVDANGKLIATPTVGLSSGSQRLDQAAIQLAEAGSGHYKPAIRNGKAESSCLVFRVRFVAPEPLAKSDYVLGLVLDLVVGLLVSLVLPALTLFVGKFVPVMKRNRKAVYLLCGVEVLIVLFAMTSVRVRVRTSISVALALLVLLAGYIIGRKRDNAPEAARE